ncbi:hypothetical protein [Phenylobacterium sp.]|uniref:hypothetical protein n=1 Tax=Phenylobacterium sp. TaxID=1871053 RepID=UPI0025F1372D|nr:hypothetical protein [Phenylobacterium sp.]
MTPERFETLAEAYGGDVTRWPAAAREAAAALMAEKPAWAGEVLARADDLDVLLDAFVPPQASADLAGRILVGAPRSRPRWAGWLIPGGMGAGLAAACAAGVLVGAQLHGASSQPSASDADALVAVVGDDDLGLYLDEEA